MNFSEKVKVTSDQEVKKYLQQICYYHLLIPEPGNYTPPSRTPWGGKEIVKQMKEGRKLGMLSDLSPIVGESWEISGHASFPNAFVVQGKKISIADLEEHASEELYGKKIHMPFLLKLLNSGSWSPYRNSLRNLLSQYDAVVLSDSWIQELEVSCLSRILNTNNGHLHEKLTLLIHLLKQPTCPGNILSLLLPLAALHKEMLTKNLSIQVHPQRGTDGSKSEAWVIIDAEPGAGIYLGLKPGITKPIFQKSLKEKLDISKLLHFIEVKKGDVFFLPSGTPHAIGAGILLLEPQECSEVTYRMFDWNRIVDGKSREIHSEEAMKSINFRAARGASLAKKLHCFCKKINGGANGIATVESLVKEPEFLLERISFSEQGDEYIHKNFFGGFIVLKGKIRVFIPGQEAVYIFCKGESFIAPAALEEAVITCDGKGSILMKISKK